MQFFKNRTVLGVMCIAAALLICFGITPLFNKSLANKAEIVRVVKQIKSGEKDYGGYGKDSGSRKL